MNLSLSDDVVALLRRACGGRGATPYIEELVRGAARAWCDALEGLLADGWSSDQMVAAIDALRGWTSGRERPLPAEILGELERSGIRATEAQALDLWELAREIRSGNRCVWNAISPGPAGSRGATKKKACQAFSSEFVIPQEKQEVDKKHYQTNASTRMDIEENVLEGKKDIVSACNFDVASYL